LIQQGF